MLLNKRLPLSSWQQLTQPSTTVPKTTNQISIKQWIIAWHYCRFDTNVYVLLTPKKNVANFPARHKDTEIFTRQYVNVWQLIRGGDSINGDAVEGFCAVWGGGWEIKWLLKANEWDEGRDGNNRSGKSRVMENDFFQKRWLGPYRMTSQDCRNIKKRLGSRFNPPCSYGVSTENTLG